MFRPDRRTPAEFDLIVARRRAAEYRPFSPAWDAAMARVEQLERLARQIDHAEADGAAAAADGSYLRRSPAAVV